MTATPGFEIDWTEERDVAILRIIGEISPADLHKVEEAGSRLIAAGHNRLVVDFSLAERISSTGMGLLLYYQNILAGTGGRLLLAAPSNAVRGLLSHARLDRVFTIYDSVGEAIAAMRKGTSSRKLQPASN